jgi:hypothetical protein
MDGDESVICQVRTGWRDRAHRIRRTGPTRVGYFRVTHA